MVLENSTFGLWWPLGYGPQQLYDFTFTYAPANGTANSTATRTLGLRKIELVREGLSDAFSQSPSWETMFFRVNGVPIYAKGAPPSPAPSPGAHGHMGGRRRMRCCRSGALLAPCTAPSQTPAVLIAPLAPHAPGPRAAPQRACTASLAG